MPFTLGAVSLVLALAAGCSAGAGSGEGSMPPGSGPTHVSSATGQVSGGSGGAGASDGSDGSDGSVGSGGVGTAGTRPDALTDPGGILHVLLAGDAGVVDPQAMAPSADSFLFSRTTVRTLTAPAPAGTDASAMGYVGDLATDTGTASEDLRTWTFTVRQGVRWDTGQELVCEDLRRGIGRAFLTEEPFAATSYAQAVLDVPVGYRGPGVSSSADQAGFDHAVSCAGATLTLRMREAQPDLPQLLAMPEFAPAAPGAAGSVVAQPHSVGPYRVAAGWGAAGGRLERNPEWDHETDPIRRALPDEVVVAAGLQEPEVIQRLLNGEGSDAGAVSPVRAAPSVLNQVRGIESVRSRFTVPWTGAVDYLALNVTSPVMSDARVRAAFAAATDRAAYVAALGGPVAGEPSATVLSPVLRGRAAPELDLAEVPTPQPAATSAGAQVRASLVSAGVAVPVAVRLAVPDTSAVTTAVTAMVPAWEAAGFAVSVTALPVDSYYDTVSAPAAKSAYDVVRSTWAPDHPSAAGVLPALFDSRLNLTEAGAGQDLGWFQDSALNERMDEASRLSGRAAQEAWDEVDQLLRDSGAYVGLAARRAVHLHGGNVVGATEHPLTGTVDLAVTGLD